MRVTELIKPKDLIQTLHSLVNADAKITLDTRQLRQGDIFLAYAVGHGKDLNDNRQYIDQAIALGAGAVLFDQQVSEQNKGLKPFAFRERLDCIEVPQLSSRAGPLCSEWYGFPSRHMNVIGVTGTNGKTTVTQWLAQALDSSKNLAGERAALIGTLGVGFPGALDKTGYTTPDAPRLQTELARLRERGAQFVAMEVSSHALEQQRIAGVELTAAIFTNLSQDHLDYHGSMAEYGAAKATLFQQAGLQYAIINLDDPFGRELAMQLLAKDPSKENLEVWGYGLSAKAFVGFEKWASRLKRVYAQNTQLQQAAYSTEFVSEIDPPEVISAAVIGEFNLSNYLAVWTTLRALGFPAAEASLRLSRVQPVLGRMELMSLSKSRQAKGPLVIVDYAHTPDALSKALQALHPLAAKRGGQLWCVFGCGGDRDQGKRPKMGHAAFAAADHIVITSDNPRSEDPEKIMAMILGGIPSTTSKSGSTILSIADRAAAILATVRNAQMNDVILVAGKGHESSQEIRGKRVEFSDQAHIQLALGDRT